MTVCTGARELMSFSSNQVSVIVTYNNDNTADKEPKKCWACLEKLSKRHVLLLLIAGLVELGSAAVTRDVLTGKVKKSSLLLEFWSGALLRTVLHHHS